MWSVNAPMSVAPSHLQETCFLVPSPLGGEGQDEGYAQIRGAANGERGAWGYPSPNPLPKGERALAVRGMQECHHAQ